MEPFYLSVDEGQLYGLYLPAEGPPCGALLWLPPFAEEANYARRHLVAAARECQRAGYASLLIDLYGTGESAGVLEQAEWPVWRKNAIDAAACLRNRSGLDSVWIVGLRMGALLAADVCEAVLPHGIIGLQPVTTGHAVLESFLRMKLVSAWNASDSSSSAQVMDELRQSLSRGQSVEIAGYRLGPQLAMALEPLRLESSGEGCTRFGSLEFRSAVAPDATPQCSPALERVFGIWQQRGTVTASDIIIRPPLWTSPDTPVSPGIGTRIIGLTERLMQ